jgi:antitoxin CptB
VQGASSVSTKSEVDRLQALNTIFGLCNARTGADIPNREGYMMLARHVRAFGVRMGFMTGSTRSSGGLDDRRKRLLFRCWHRGMREMDLILGRFADAKIDSLTDAELTDIESLIEAPDPDLYAALSGGAPLAPEYRTALFDRIKSFRPSGRGA